MDGNDFIDLAGRLAATPGSHEATYRTAVSRAYYGAFHIARSFLTELGFDSVGNASVHGFVRNCLFGSCHPDACSAASQLGHLQTERNRADYRLEDSHIGTQRNAMVSVERAHGIVSAIERCREDEVSESIRQAIAEYERRIRPR